MIMVVGLLHRFSRFCTLLALLCLALGQARAVTLKEARQLYATGEYAKAIKASEAAIAANEYDSGWRLLLLRVRLTTGEYPEARQFATELLRDYRYRSNAEALWLFHLAYAATGELALAKRDFKLAGQIFTRAVGQYPDDADLLYGLAKAYAESDPSQMEEPLHTAMFTNPDHVPSLL